MLPLAESKEASLDNVVQGDEEVVIYDTKDIHSLFYEHDRTPNNTIFVGLHPTKHNACDILSFISREEEKAAEEKEQNDPLKTEIVQLFKRGFCGLMHHASTLDVP